MNGCAGDRTIRQAYARSTRMIKVLFVIPSFPLPAHSGGAIATLETLRSIASLCDLHVLTPPPEKEAASSLGKLQELLPGVTVHFYQALEQLKWFEMYTTAALTTVTGKSYWALSWRNRDLRVAVQRLVNSHKFDLIHAEWLQTAASIWDLNIPLLVRTLDVHFVGMLELANTIPPTERLRKSFWRRQAERFRLFEARILSAASMVVTLSPEDEMVLRHEGVTNIETIPPPRALAAKPRRNPDNAGNTRLAVFIGRLDMAVNREAFFIFADNIWPKVRASGGDQVKVIFAGGFPDAAVRRRAAAEGIEIHAPLSDGEAQTLFETADIFFSPVNTGTGIKIKTLEAMAQAIPMIGFRNAFRGVPAKDGQHALVADSPEEFASRMEILIADAKLRADLGTNGQRLIQESFDPAILGSRLIDSYTKAVQGFNRRIEAMSA